MDPRMSYSDLQVTPSTSPQVVPGDAIPQVVAVETGMILAEKITHNYGSRSVTSTQRICGLSSTLFYVTAAGVSVVLLAAVGGSIGGALSQRNASGPVISASDSIAGSTSITKLDVEASTQPRVSTTSMSSNGPSQSSVSISSALPAQQNPDKTTITQQSTTQQTTFQTTTTQQTTPKQTTTEIVGPNKTLYRDCPSSNDTLYSPPDANDQQFRKLCNNRYLGSTHNVVNKASASLNDCIGLCAQYNVKNMTEIKSGQGSPCSMVCWRNTFDTDYPGQCFGSAIQNSTDGQFLVSSEAKDIECDSAAWVNMWELT
ncbi:hypothetical protein SCAR479_05201 [Seiridium cardinale]|uniref:Uncharacterized protein n=1 Tax=Seiridium cardinale TaxID=138064 RepID=A0ABR2XWQ7_9PEZI